MTSLQNRPPAFDSLKPKIPKFIPLAEEDPRQELCELIGLAGRLSAWNADAKNWIGFYKIEARQKSIFLKIVPKEHAQTQAFAEQIAKWLKSKSVPVSSQLMGFPISLPKGNIGLGYQFIESKFCELVSSNLKEAGVAIAKLHKALEKYERQRDIMLLGAKRYKSLKLQCEIIRREKFNENSNVARLKDLLERNELELFNRDVKAQPLHGDLVYANIIFTSHGKATICDFEDAVMSWDTKDLDLALMIERFILIPSNYNETAIRHCSSLLESYGRVMGDDRPLLFHLRDTLQFLSIRSLLSLSKAESEGCKVMQAEWDKFFSLYENSRLAINLLERIDDRFSQRLMWG